MVVGRPGSRAERMMQDALSSREPVALLLVTGLILLWSGITPYDRITWWLEVAPVLIGALGQSNSSLVVSGGQT